MSTYDKLQALLATPVKTGMESYFYKEVAKPVICTDGASVSIQASKNHYSTPRANVGPYTEVEVWCVEGAVVTEFDYSDENPSCYVPIADVVLFLDNHGGIKV
jgi:hypothetical protein